MLMTALAWNLKAWQALSLEVGRGCGQAEQQAQQLALLSLEFRTFVNYLWRIPAQVRIKLAGLVRPTTRNVNESRL